MPLSTRAVNYVFLGLESGGSVLAAWVEVVVEQQKSVVANLQTGVVENVHPVGWWWL